MFVMGQIGGSGNWVAWEVTQPAGRVEWAEKTGKVFTGHVPDSATHAGRRDEVIKRQIRRQAGDANENYAPRGGHVFSLEV